MAFVESGRGPATQWAGVPRLSVYTLPTHSTVNSFLKQMDVPLTLFPKELWSLQMQS